MKLGINPFSSSIYGTRTSSITNVYALRMNYHEHTAMIQHLTVITDSEVRSQPNAHFYLTSVPALGFTSLELKEICHVMVLERC